eukprot:GHVR01005227.1.p1 GENE.GHVR01005227.1~~GHVR01005227.1.p1  ORF type:complete len:128 (-),score=71.60 GHVR01005227.1:194-556(-)
MNSYDRDTRDPYSFKATHTFSPSIKDYGDNQKDIHYSYKEKRWSKDKLKDSPRKDVYYNAHTHTHTHTHTHVVLTHTTKQHTHTYIYMCVGGCVCVCVTHTTIDTHTHMYSRNAHINKYS